VPLQDIVGEQSKNSSVTSGKSQVRCPASTYIDQLCRDASPEDLPTLMQERDKWRDRQSLTQSDDDDFSDNNLDIIF